MENSENIHEISMPEKGNDNYTIIDGDKWENKIPHGTTIKYNPYSTIANRKNIIKTVRIPRVGLSHELSHSNDADKGIGDSRKVKINGIYLSDIKAVNIENRIRSVTGNPKRTTYAGRKIPKELLE